MIVIHFQILNKKHKIHFKVYIILIQEILYLFNFLIKIIDYILYECKIINIMSIKLMLLEEKKLVLLKCNKLLVKLKSPESLKVGELVLLEEEFQPLK
jgi:hypothetical protein